MATSLYNKDLPIDPEKGINVTQYGWNPEDIRGVTLIQDYVQQATVIRDEVLKVQADLQILVNDAQKVKDMYKYIEDAYVDFTAKYPQILNLYDKIVELQNTCIQQAGLASGSANSAASSASEALIHLNEIKTIQSDLDTKYLDIKTKHAEVTRMTSEVTKLTEESRQLVEELRKGQVYRGIWNPNTGSWPDPKGTNSVWDVNLNDGQKEFDWNAIKWLPGDRLIYTALTKVFDQIESGSGVLSVNGKTGYVTVTPQDLGVLTSSEVDSKLTGYVPTSRLINRRPLTTDITLTAADVGAVSSKSPGSNVETQPYSLRLGASEGDGSGVGGWARAYQVSGGSTSINRFNYGAYGYNQTALFGYMNIDSTDDAVNNPNSLRVYPTYPAWGTNKIYHEGFKPTPDSIGAISKKEWVAKVRLGSWSSIATFYNKTLGGKAVITVGHTRNSFVANARFLISWGHFNQATITQLESHGYSQISVRVSMINSNDCQFEILDDNYLTAPQGTEVEYTCQVDEIFGQVDMLTSFTASSGSPQSTVQTEYQSIKINNNKVYHQGFKPTASEVGAVNRGIIGNNTNLDTYFANEHVGLWGVMGGNNNGWPWNNISAGSLLVESINGIAHQTASRSESFDTMKRWRNSVTGDWSKWTSVYNGVYRPAFDNWAHFGETSLNVTGGLIWRNFGNNHVIFDASAGLSPNGGPINNTNATNPWTGTFPTLMGWNGVDTYGVRVDSARVADSAADSVKKSGDTMSGPLTVNNTLVVDGVIHKIGGGDIIIGSQDRTPYREGQIYNIGGELTFRSDLNTDSDSLGGMRFSAANHNFVGGPIVATGTAKPIWTQGGVIRANTSQVMSLDGNTYSFVTSPEDAHLCYNSYWDGANWLKYDNSKTSGYIVVNRNGLSYNTSSAGQSNPVSNSYKVYHEGFKPTPADLGAANAQEVYSKTHVDNKSWMRVQDIRNTNAVPNTFQDMSISSWFNNTSTPSAGWYSGVNVRGWSGDYATWQLVSGSDLPDTQAANPNQTSLWFRSGNAGSWGPYQKVYTTYNKPTAGEIGAAPAGFGLGDYGKIIGTIIGDTELRRQSGFFQGSSIAGLPASPHTWNYVFSQAHGNLAGYFGYLAISFNGNKAWIGGQEGGVQKGPFEVVLNNAGQRFVGAGVGNDYHQGAIEVIGNGTDNTIKPVIGFHQPGVYAASLGVWAGDDFRFHTQGLAAYAGITTGNVNANDVYIRSDRRLKTNLKPLDKALDKVNQLTAYSYDKKQTLKSEEYDKHEVGLIAQEVEKVLPEAINKVVDSNEEESGKEILTISNSAVNALLVEAIKELTAKVESLEKRLKEVENAST